MQVKHVHAHVLGLPRLGAKREYKWSLEKYWAGKIGAAELHAQMASLRQANYRLQVNAGLDLVCAGDFAYYDHILELSESLGVVPERHVREPDRLARCFAMARGSSGGRASEMKKWFNTNYHYIVPELQPQQQFAGAETATPPTDVVQQCREAAALGKPVKAVLTGPLTYLYLAKLGSDGKFAPTKLEFSEKLAAAYANIAARLVDAGVAWLQLDEPVLALDLPPEWRSQLGVVYAGLSKSSRPKVMVACQYGAIADRVDIVAQLDIDGIHIDIRNGMDDLERTAEKFSGKVVSVGAVDGRNVWRTNLPAVTKRLEGLAGRAGGLWVGTSCTLLHVPVDATHEDALLAANQPIAFALQKIQEVAALARTLTGTAQDADRKLFETSPDFPIEDPGWVDGNEEVLELTPSKRKFAFGCQDILFPTTTIGSLPQTSEIRAVRAAWRKGKLDDDTYAEKMRDEIKNCVAEQEALGLDVLVHGECERNDMVEYFAHQLDGISAPVNGWVQSYGSRATRPPLIHGDVVRAQPMTVKWSKFAASLTDKPMKGMLTGPITIICWSFPHAVLPRMRTGFQIADALHDEVADLAAAGLPIIQIDEPALREGLPLPLRERPAYLAQAVAAFNRIVGDSDVQIHTHMCYGEFNDVAAAISAMDADVISLETSRTDMSVLQALVEQGHGAGVGPGIYDVHSPRVPTVAEMAELLQLALRQLPPERIWVNPDCGLKTRGWEETRAALLNMTAAAAQLRAAHS